jgi:hypothetical protein
MGTLVFYGKIVFWNVTYTDQSICDNGTLNQSVILSVYIFWK